MRIRRNPSCDGLFRYLEMLKHDTEAKKVILLTGRVDMRKGIDGLVALVRLRYGLDPLEPGTLFLFCGTRRDRIKALIYEGDGFTLAYKRLTCGVFNWPRNAEEARSLTREEFDRLMDGYTIESSIRGICPDTRDCSRRNGVAKKG